MKATYKDVKSDILSKITTGEWELGNLVPNEVDLATTYGCARATVNRAMRELADDGLIERRRKAGTRVRMTPIRQARFDIPIVRVEIQEKGAEYRYSLVSSSVEIAPDWLRARLKLSNKSAVLRLICMHYAEVYSSDFGELKIVPSNRSREASLLLVDPEFAKVSYLRDFKTVDIATIGDAEAKMIVVEYGLEVSNEAAHGIVADLNES